MKHAHTKTIDTKGLRQVVTTVAIAGALAGWAVLARPDAPVAATTTSIASTAAQSAAPVVASAPASTAAQSAAPVVASAAESTAGATAAPSKLRVVTAPAPVTATRSSR